MDISIIIPVFNCAPYLKMGFKHLKPLYTSNLKFEIIYVNDGSTDNSLVILEKLKATNRFVKIIYQENQGSSVARNSAIDIAQGKYIQFLDADDYLDVDKIIVFLEKTMELDLDIIGYRTDFVDESGKCVGEMTKHSVQYNEIITGEQTLISGYQPSSICVFLFKTAFLNNFNLRITPKITHMDVEFTLRMMLCAKKVYFIDEIAYHYLQRLGSITKPRSIKKREQLLYDEVVIADLMRANIEPVMSKELVQSIQKNYNSVIWNLLWRFLIKPKEVSYHFKMKCIHELSNKNLYPIKGPLKTNFQSLLKPIFNVRLFLQLFLRIR